MATNTSTQQRNAWRTEWAKLWTWLNARAGHRPPANLSRKQRRANWKQEWRDAHFRELVEARRQRREFWRNVIGALLVLASPLIFFMPFWLAALFGQ